MSFNNFFSRSKLITAMLFGLLSGAAYADLDTGSLFFIATDEDRGGVEEAFILDLQLNFLTDDVAGSGGLTDAGLAAWLTDPAASSLITWGIFGAGTTGGSAGQFRIASTVNPGHGVPVKIEQNFLSLAIGAGRGVASRFNTLAAGDIRVVSDTGDINFPPQNFGDNWNGQVSFIATGGLDEALPMYIFGIQEDFPFAAVDPVELDGLWSLDSASGTLAFAPVPLPAAIWMFAAGALGLFARRRGETV